MAKQIVNKELIRKLNINHNPPEVKSVGDMIQIYFYVKKECGYHCLGLTLENAVAFFKKIRKACESEHEVMNVPIFTEIMDNKGTMKFYKEDLELIRPLLANELNYRTGKKERPPDPDKPDWRKVLGQIENVRDEKDEKTSKAMSKGKEEVSAADKKKYARQRKTKKKDS